MRQPRGRATLCVADAARRFDGTTMTHSRSIAQDGRTRVRSLGSLEAQVMDVLWSQPSAAHTVREVLDALRGSGPKEHAYTTVMTVLENLCRKELVSRHKHGRSFQYEATTSREQHTAELLDGILSTATDTRATLMRFVESMSEAEIEDLTKALFAVRHGEQP